MEYTIGFQPISKIN